MGYFEKRLPKKQLSKGPLFYEPDHIYRPNISEQACQKIANQAKQISKGKLTFFSHALVENNTPPHWFWNPFNNKVHRKKTAYWSDADDPEFGDIKILWEISRMDWALVFSKMTAISKDRQYIHLLNHWLSDWIDNNMPQSGPNWICAQETAIRLIQIIMCAYILNQTKPLPALIEFVNAHCQRIFLTRHYADAQQNNHAISEAAGLFIGGLWLENYSQLHKYSNKWLNDGRNDLEWLVNKLVADDGSFAQQSLNYHRVLIATLNMVEYFRQLFKKPKFSSKYYQKVRDAIFWQYQMVDPMTGNAPNLGANDGARLYALSESKYTDYRPEIQLGGGLFMENRFYQKGDCDEPLQWLQLKSDRFSTASIQRTSHIYPDGGYVILSSKFKNLVPTWGLIRCPNNRFRPHHADALHFDLWVKGMNVLRDSGSYSYDISASVRSSFISTTAHNTVSFDSHDQMPVISRFLYGQWIQAKTIQSMTNIQTEKLSWCGDYTDYKKCYHKRQIQFDKIKWRIIDKLARFNQKAVIRWRLMNDHWVLEKHCLAGNFIKLKISTNVKNNVTLSSGFESHYYMDKQEIPVLEICVLQSPAIVITEISLVDAEGQTI
jgi:hypothetical protein